AVADGNAGLAILDLSNLAEVTLREVVPLGAEARAIAIAGPLAYVGLSDGVVAVVNLALGEVLDWLPTGTSAVEDVLVIGDTLYVLTTGQLHAVPLASDPPSLSGSAPANGLASNLGRWRLAGGGSRLYAATLDGWSVYGLENPNAPIRIRFQPTAQRGWRHLVPNGSGFGLAAVGPNLTDDGPQNIDVLDLRPGGTNNLYLGTFVTPGRTRALAIYGGLAYVADHTGGLQVVNVLPPDRGGVAPLVSLRPSFPLNPAVAEERQWVRITADTTDDVQVRLVEFYIDGVRTVTDGNVPFEVRLLTPALTPGRTQFTLRARALDMAGNERWSDPLQVELVRDLSEPYVRRFTPPGGGSSVERVSAYFSEPMSITSISHGGFRVLGPGLDGISGTDDDTPLTPCQVEEVTALSLVSLRFDPPLSNGTYLVQVTTNATDLAGNRVSTPQNMTLRVVDAAFWNGRTVIEWTNASLWSIGRVPGTNDTVILDTQPNRKIRIEGATVRVANLLATDELEVVNSTVDITGTLVAERG
ncbi:hypothetical protein EG835_05670, partial [bacterium]|nr:hypothetical protein [bacterium]